MKRTVCVLLILLCALSCTVLAGGRFDDVKESDWFYSDVENAVELGLINGKGNNTYCPNDNLTYAEAVKLAACMNEKYLTGKVTLQNGDPWYKTYFDYCKQRGIIDGYYNSYPFNEKITREGYMQIFAKALPDEALKTVNYVPNDSIPDVKMSDEYAEAVYKLYRAGIVAGSDAEHNCKPDSNIKRSEVAAILSRMMDETKRVKFSIGTPAEKLNVTSHPKSGEAFEGDPFELSVSVGGGESPYSYTWQVLRVVNGTETWMDVAKAIYNPVGVGTDTIVLNTVPAGASSFRCVITDGSGQSVISNVAKFDIKTHPSAFLKTSVSVTKNPYLQGSVMVYCTATGGKPPYTYTWEKRDGRYTTQLKDTTDYKGTSTNCIEYTFLPLNPLNGEQVRVKVVDSDGQSVYSEYVTTPETMLVMGIEDMSKTDNEISFVCTVREGSLTPGESIFLYSTGLNLCHRATVERIEMFDKSLDKATKGDRCNIVVKADTFEKVTEAKIEGAIGNTFAVYAISSRLSSFSVKAPLKYRDDMKDEVAELDEEVSFTVTAVGGKAPYTYEWLWSGKDGGEYSPVNQSAVYRNVNTDTLTVLVGVPQYSMRFACRITDANGSVINTGSVKIDPVGLVQNVFPESVYANYGDKVTLKADAIGRSGAVINYKWQVKTGNSFVDILPTDTWASGAKTSTLTLDVDKSTFSHVSTFRCVIWDSRGNTIETKNVYIYPEKPFIIIQPSANVFANTSELETVSISVAGKYSPLKYEWQYSDSKTGGFVSITSKNLWAGGFATSALNIKAASGLESGTKIRCVITDAKGNKVTSAESVITVSSSPDISFQ